MKAAQLLAHFETISDAPDAIVRLRRFISALALRGRLVPQDVGAAPIVKELEQARAKLAKVAKNASRLRWQPSKPIMQDEVLWELPPGWTAARINDTGLYINGLPFKPSDWKPEGTPIVRIQNLSRSTNDFNYAQGEFPSEVIVQPGDLLVSWSATLDAYRWSGPRAVLNQHIFRVIRQDTLTHPDYLLLALKTAIRSMGAGDHARGLVMTHINRGPFLSHVLALPPMAEQHRIVARYEELMTLCDQLEAKREEREARRNRLTSASFTRLSTPNPETFGDDVRFALRCLQSFTARPDQIRQLRQTILSLAVRGKLVRQDPQDEPASSLLRAFSAAKMERKSASGDARIAAAAKPNVDALPMVLPKGWDVESFENLFLFIDYRGNTPLKTANGIPLITAKNIRMGSLDREPREFVSQATYKNWMTRGFPGIGDLLFTTEAPLANICVSNLVEPFALAQRAICFQPYSTINTTFLMLAIMSDVVQDIIHANATGMTAKGIKAATLKPLPLPIPPAVEQGRIVSRVDQLMTLCDHLESSLRGEDESRSGLLSSILVNALEPAEARDEAA